MAKTTLLTYLIWDATTYRDDQTVKKFMTVDYFQAFAASIGRETEAPAAWEEWEGMKHYYV